MKSTQGNGINLYEAYIEQSRKEQSGRTGKLLTLLLPLAIVVLALLGVSGKLILDNRAKSETLDTLDAQLATLSETYDDARLLTARRDECADEYEQLRSARFLFSIYPAPTKALFTEVIACAEGIFNISQYDYNEQAGILTINASAASVNEVPQLVQRLRDTGMFSLVQYTGYTSRDTTEYFCTVSCTLDNVSEYALEGTLDAEGELDGNAEPDGNAEGAS